MRESVQVMRFLFLFLALAMTQCSPATQKGPVDLHREISVAPPRVALMIAPKVIPKYGSGSAGTDLATRMHA